MSANPRSLALEPAAQAFSRPGGRCSARRVERDERLNSTHPGRPSSSIMRADSPAGRDRVSQYLFLRIPSLGWMSIDQRGVASCYCQWHLTKKQ
jgi:hypothetical protein